MTLSVILLLVFHVQHGAQFAHVNLKTLPRSRDWSHWTETTHKPADTLTLHVTSTDCLLNNQSTALISKKPNQNCNSNQAEALQKIDSMPGGTSASTNKAEKGGQLTPLRTIPVNRSIPSLTYETEGQWTGPFWFMQAADPQLGMIDSFVNKNPLPGWQVELDLIKKMIKIAKNAKPKPRFIIVCGDLVDARPNSLKAAQIEDFKKAFLDLDPEIRLICVCGNHDIGDKPSPTDITDYRKDFGDDYFSFWLGGVKFVVLNSQYYVDYSLVTENRLEQDKWLDEELKADSERPWKHLIGFQHIPPFINKPEETGIYVPNSTVLPFNFPNLDERRLFLNKLKLSNMSHLFCGHYHRNGGGFDDNLEVVVTTAVGCQLGSDHHGFRTVVVTSRHVKHHFYGFDDAPSTIDLSDD